ncbi:DUF3859 domain-containing protein [Hasllibacter halocynthiae]|nr:DUF3859 domain-containing protein [Hasllibacter halocynthiae]
MRTLALALALLAGPALGAGIVADKDRVELVSHGLYCMTDGELVEAPETASGTVWQGRIPDFRHRTLEVPARTGLTFGIEYRGTGPIETVVTGRTAHPPFDVSPITEYVRPVPLPPAGAAPSFLLYTFDFPYEEVPGEWTFEVLDALSGTSILSVTFAVVPDEGQPPFLRCQGPPVA